MNTFKLRNTYMYLDYDCLRKPFRFSCRIIDSMARQLLTVSKQLTLHQQFINTL